MEGSEAKAEAARKEGREGGAQHYRCISIMAE